MNAEVELPLRLGVIVTQVTTPATPPPNEPLVAPALTRRGRVSRLYRTLTADQLARRAAMLVDRVGRVPALPRQQTEEL